MQAQVGDGVPIGTCLMLFGRWLQEVKDKNGFKFPCEQLQKKDQENNAESLNKWCTFVTWSGKSKLRRILIVNAESGFHLI